MKKNNPLIKLYIYFLAFSTGAVILIIEILGTRIMAPFYGATIFVWSSLIGVTLLSLACGYFAGGLLADKRPGMAWAHYILLAAAVFIIIMPAVSRPVLKFSGVFGPRFGSLTGALMLFALPLFFLGMISPYTVKLSAAKLSGIGMTAGSLYAAATAGSFVGAVSAGFYLVPLLGIRFVLNITGAFLMLISLGYLAAAGKKRAAAFFAVIFICAFAIRPGKAGGLAKKGWEKLYITHSPYFQVSVFDSPAGYRYLFLDGGVQTYRNLKNGRFDCPYLELFDKALDACPKAEDVLVIGIGGGGIEKKIKGRGLNTTYVEIDRKVVKAAGEYFGFDGKTVINDGRNYIRNTEKKFDIIFLDAFSGHSVYPYLFSAEAFREIRAVLNDGGMLVINSGGRLYPGMKSGVLTDRAVSSIYATAGRVFDNIKIRASAYGLANFVFYASDKKFKLAPGYIDIRLKKTGDVITDDHNTLEYMMTETAEKWREVHNKITGYNYPM